MTLQSSPDCDIFVDPLRLPKQTSKISYPAGSAIVRARCESIMRGRASSVELVSPRGRAGLRCARSTLPFSSGGHCCAGRRRLAPNRRRRSGSSSTGSRIRAAIVAPISLSPTGDLPSSRFVLGLVVFDRGGTIRRRLAVDVAPVRPAKTMVKVFDIPETACSAIGGILVNDVIHCRDASGDVAGCVDRLSTSSKLAVTLLK